MISGDAVSEGGAGFGTGFDGFDGFTMVAGSVIGGGGIDSTSGVRVAQPARISITSAVTGCMLSCRRLIEPDNPQSSALPEGLEGGAPPVLARKL